MSTNQYNKRSHLGRRTLISAAALTIAGVGLQLNFAENAKADEPKPMLMFVQVADDLKADPAANTLRLVNVSKQTLYFSDRPVRLAGHLKMADYLEEWTKRAGKDNFGNDPHATERPGTRVGCSHSLPKHRASVIVVDDAEECASGRLYFFFLMQTVARERTTCILKTVAQEEGRGIMFWPALRYTLS